MKMMFAEKVRQTGAPRSEYGGSTNRRMIGYDREGSAENRRMPTEPIWRGYGNSSMNMMGAERGYAENYSDKFGNNLGSPYYDEMHPLHNGGTEARRRRDSRGRYMMANRMMDDEYDEEDDPRSYRPNMMGSYPKTQSGGSYGDIYADIYAPNAMNRPMGSDQNESARPVDEHTARMWVQKMDGGEHFKAEHAEQLRMGICPECKKWEYYVAINAMYSDHCETAKKMGVDKPEFYAHLAKDFLCDLDAGPHKLQKYMMTIPK